MLDLPALIAPGHAGQMPLVPCSEVRANPRSHPDRTQDDHATAIDLIKTSRSGVRWPCTIAPDEGQRAEELTMAVSEQAAPAAPSNAAIGDLLRQRKRALRAVQASTMMRTRGENLSSWSPKAALYKKRRALRHELATSSPARASERKPNGSRDEVDQPTTADADAENRPRGRWFSALLDSPNTDAHKISSSAAPSAAASDSPKVRRVIHGVLQSPGEVHLSDAAKKARRQLTRIRNLTSDGSETSVDEPVFCGQTVAVSRAAFFSADLDAGVPNGAIMCADLGQAFDAQRNAAAAVPNTRTEQQVAADVAESAVSRWFTNAIRSTVGSELTAL